MAFKLALFWQAYDELLDQGRAKDGIGKALAWWKRWFRGHRSVKMEKTTIWISPSGS
jgi:hypothetical protein